MQLERRALYNLLRMTWLNDPSTETEPWQVEDYRSLSGEEIFQRVENLGIALDSVSFNSNADSADNPENLSDLVVEDLDLDTSKQDQAYLLIFELWRRLMPEKLCLSIFCDELDHQIFLYDNGGDQEAELMQDAVANLQVILDENTDQGGDPSAIFELVCANCANDLKTFLYDYISDQIEYENIGYASELVEGFGIYLQNDLWFDLLKVRLLDLSDTETAQANLKKLVQKAAKNNDIELNLEILAFVSREGNSEDFHKIVKNTILLLQTEEDFQDLLSLCGDYFRLLDLDKKESAIDAILQKRLPINLSTPISPSDGDLQNLRDILKQ